MSYPRGFSRLHIGDKGTQRMARGEDNVGSRMDEDLSSTSSEDDSLRVEAAGVITWLILVGESRANAFWKKFSFPPNVRVSFSSSRPRFATCTEEERGGMNLIYWSEVHINEGLRFPLLPLGHQFFHFTRLNHIHTHVNIIYVLLGACVLNRKYEVHLGLEEVLYAYSLK